MCRACDDWGYSGVHRRDFRASKDGPEVMPHKKKSKGKPRKRIDHKHEFIEEYREVWYRDQPELYFVCAICKYSDWKKAWYQRKLRRA